MTSLALLGCGAQEDDSMMMMDPATSSTTPMGSSGMPTVMPMPSGTGGMGGMPPMDTPPVRTTTGPSYGTTLSALFDAKCTTTCHEPGGLLGGPGGIQPVMMDLTPGAAYAALTSGKSIQATAMWIVDETTESSYLWHKLNDTHATVGGSGAVMPLTGDRLTAAELEIVQAWIEGGATP